MYPVTSLISTSCTLEMKSKFNQSPRYSSLTFLSHRVPTYIVASAPGHFPAFQCYLLRKHFPYELLEQPSLRSIGTILCTFMYGLIVAHFQFHSRDALDRQLQAETSASILGNTTNPVVMLSYITNPPGSRDYRRIVEHGRVKVCFISHKLKRLFS